MPRATQTEEFWRDEFDVREADETALQEFFIQQGKPLPADAIARQLMERRVGTIRRGSAGDNGSYSPTSQYEVGQTIAFPLLDQGSGEVVGIRPGENDRYGSFDVIQVRFDGEEKAREFATNLDNYTLGMPGESQEPELSAEELYALYGPYVLESAEWALSRSANFTRLAGQWLPTVMLVTFHEGHLNIADAMIDVIGEPMGADELLPELSVEEEASDEVKRFSLNHALSRDSRFVNNGTEEQPRWFLRRLG